MRTPLGVTGPHFPTTYAVVRRSSLCYRLGPMFYVRVCRNSQVILVVFVPMLPHVPYGLRGLPTWFLNSTLAQLLFCSLDVAIAVDVCWSHTIKLIGSTLLPYTAAGTGPWHQLYRAARGKFYTE
jgi:hypothetical protein